MDFAVCVQILPYLLPSEPAARRELGAESPLCGLALTLRLTCLISRPGPHRTTIPRKTNEVNYCILRRARLGEGDLCRLSGRK